MNKIWDKIIEIGATEGGSTLHRVAKLSEETGELAAAVLLKEGYKLNKHGLTEKDIEREILDEGSDVILVVFDLLNKAGYTKEDIKHSLKKKMVAWENVIRKNKEK